MDAKTFINHGFKGYRDFLKKRNTIADAFFYDVNSLTAEEQKKITNEINREGSILIIPPKGSGREYKNYPTALEFLGSRHKDVSKFVIAGVGSSDLGGASLARNVADFFSEDVGTIVAGYGMADLMTEAMGGWFSIGYTNKVASYIEETSDILDAEKDISIDTDIHHYVAGHPDSRTLLRLLLSKENRIDFILGHSKGCLSLANALNGLVSGSSVAYSKKCAEKIQIITTGAVIELPDIFSEKAFQYLGGIDWFGGMNSRLNLEFKTIPGAWHHTNKELPFAMDIKNVLSEFVQCKKSS